MAISLFITGASGFIGHHLVARLIRQRYDHINCLRRSERTSTKRVHENGLRWLEGSLFDSQRYENCLSSGVTVVHLAATTGKAPAKQYFSVNCDGTRHLLARCQERKVKNFLYVSSIAVNYPDKSFYYYAQSKLEGEELVRMSGLNHTIVRPTIVLGRESSAWKVLSRLAGLRWMPVIGDGTARIQPIDVDDLADAMISVIEEQDFQNESFDLGGPEVVTIEEFLRKVRRLYGGDTRNVLHVPYEPLKRIIAYADRCLPSLLPLNAGQLSVFVQDGTVTSNRVYEKRRPYMKDLDTVLRSLTAGTRE